ncbi:MAG TPA: hypothetical protein VFU95_03585, partial [Telluria sp.]|nr:hypothetical protein [Telluria sp.]
MSMFSREYGCSLSQKASDSATLETMPRGADSQALTMTASSPTPLTGYAGVLNHREAEHHFNIPFGGEKISTYSCVVIGQILFAKLVQACPQRRSIT